MSDQLDGAAISLHGKVFAGVSNSADGDVDAATRFTYHQDGEQVWAEYAGGQVRRGFLVGTRAGDRLSFRYVHLSVDGTTATGRCESQISVTDDGRVRLDESWAWESRPGTGTSIVEQVTPV